MRRRTFVGLAGASLFSAMLEDGGRGNAPVDAEPFAPVLAGHPADAAPGQLDAAPDITALTAAVNDARRQYQACRYSELIKQLPGLLARLPHYSVVAYSGTRYYAVPGGPKRTRDGRPDGDAEGHA